MSDASSSVAAPRKGGSTLRKVLFLIFFVMLGVLGYDLYARWVTARAYAKLEDWVEQDIYASPEEVHELLGRKPDKGLVAKGDYYEETYSWRRGDLFRTFFVTVLYSKEDSKPVLLQVAKDQPVDEGAFAVRERPRLIRAFESPEASDEISSSPEVADGTLQDHVSNDHVDEDQESTDVEGGAVQDTVLEDTVSDDIASDSPEATIE